MSSFNNKQSAYCKVCHDAGKTQQEYTSHFVKSKPGPGGIIVCPTLKSLTCNYCLASGHTPSHCSKLNAKKAAEAKALKKQSWSNYKVTTPIKAPAPIKPANSFDLLSLDSSDEDDKSVKNIKVSTNKPKKSQNNTMEIAAKKEEFSEEFPALPLAKLKKPELKREQTTSSFFHGYAAAVLAEPEPANNDMSSHTEYIKAVDLLFDSTKEEFPQIGTFSSKKEKPIATKSYASAIINIPSSTSTLPVRFADKNDVFLFDKTLPTTNNKYNASHPDCDWAAEESDNDSFNLDSDSDDDEDWHRY